MSSVTDEIKARIDLVELIGRSVPLKRVGSAYRGLCPFHTEKTPSFYVRPQTNTFHCFGCTKGGTAFDWLIEREHLDFPEALRQLAHMAGVELPARRDAEQEEQHQRLYTLLERAQTFYAGLLRGTAGARARAYFLKRGLTEETLDSFGLGYAPSGHALLRYLSSEGFGEQELQAAGVIGTADDGHSFDFFRERVLFPIRDAQGRTIAFGGRAIEDGVQPKYLNSRDTLLFHKQETLFALDLARKPISQERQAVIVEGYMDAVMAHQHGFRNVIATLGTAVTDRHLRLLRRWVDEIVLALDADAAGQAATWRALQVADESLRTGVTPVVGPNRKRQRFVPDRQVHLRVLALPGAKDPDDLIRSDPRAWPALVRAAVPVIDFVLQRLEARHDLTSATGKAAAADEAAEVLAGIASPIEQDHYVNEVALRLRVDAGAVRQILRRKQRSARADLRSDEPRGPEGDLPQSRRPAKISGHDAQGEPDDDYVLALLIHRRKQPDAPRLEAEPEFVLDESRWLYRSLDGEIPEALQPGLERARAYLPIVERLPAHRLAEELRAMQLRIRKRLLLQRNRELAAQQRQDGMDAAEFAALLDRNVAQIAEIERQLPPERESVGAR
jgi:DNA primase